MKQTRTNKKPMKRISKKKKVNKLAILFAIFLIVVAVFIVKVVMIFTESDEEAVYGSRLEVVENLKIDESEKEKKIKEKLGDHVSSVKVRVQGRIINIELDITKDIPRDWAKDDCKNIMEFFSDEEKKVYDFQYYVQKTVEAENSKQFPIIGYKHHSAEEIKWTKDR
ncbi:MAG: hypothetical protein IJ193_04905 [Bacilli bacterium]|nr:hypothetical protein [Bacilli bacterium]